MADSARKQSLIVAFAFGWVVCAAVGTVLFHLRGGASSLVRGGLRLALAGFLLFVSLWAVTGFVGTFINEGSSPACHVAVALASAFDQIARITLEEYLFWSVKRHSRATLAVCFTQTVIFLRFILGAIFVGVLRPRFAPICVATNRLGQIGVAVAVADAGIVLLLLTKASSAGTFRDAKMRGMIGLRAQGLAFTTIALGLWIPLSIPMILDVSGLGVAARSALPSVGALVVIVCIAYFYKGLIWSQEGLIHTTVTHADKFSGLDDTTLPHPRDMQWQEESTIGSARYPTGSSFHSPELNGPVIHPQPSRYTLRLVPSDLPAPGPAHIAPQLRGSSTVQCHGQTTVPLKIPSRSPLRQSPADHRKLTPAVHRSGLKDTAGDLLVPTMLPQQPKDRHGRPLSTVEDISDTGYRQHIAALSVMPHGHFVDQKRRSLKPSSRTALRKEETNSVQDAVQPDAISRLREYPCGPEKDEAVTRSEQTQSNMVGSGSGLGVTRVSRSEPHQPEWDESASGQSVMDRPRPIPRSSGVTHRASFRKAEKSPVDDDGTKPSCRSSRGKSTLLQAPAGSSSQTRPRSPNSEGIDRQSVSSNDFKKGQHVSEGTRPSEAAARFASKYSLAVPISPLNDFSSAYSQPPTATLRLSSKTDPKRKSSPVLPVYDLQESATPASIRAGRFSSDPRNQVLAGELQDISNEALLEELHVSPSPYTGKVGDESTFHNGEDVDRLVETVTVVLNPSQRTCGGTAGERESWHRRVGEICPTFSDRNSGQSRRVSKLPPPPPLPLDLEKITRRFKGPAPQISPLETSPNPFDTIHEKLREFDESDISCGDTEVTEPSITLLEDAETEMGPGESRWQYVRVEISQKSCSTFASSISSPFPDKKQSPAAPRASPGGSAVPGPEMRCVAEHNGSTVEAVTSIMTPSERNGSRTMREIWEGRRCDPDLWQTTDSDADAGAISWPESLSTSSSENDMQPTCLDVSDCRPASRRFSEPAALVGETAWHRAGQTTTWQSRPLGLWTAGLQPSQTLELSPMQGRTPGRPLTVKPPRKSRRISSLADILEDPVPLRNQRRTLGIYRFPWGEKSDTATPNMAPAAASFFPMSSAQMQMLPFRGEQQEQALFFHGGSGYASDGFDPIRYYSDGDGDSFDETTLWEIAGLLKSDEIPSRESLPRHQESYQPSLVAAHGDDDARGPSMPSVPTQHAGPQSGQEITLRSTMEETSLGPRLVRKASSPTLVGFPGGESVGA
ncbi:hypothetical protein E4U42_000041 [Claviceps africana]|uniref:Uncharacterized protein n=1 Tax=Claviceps africana TaxID=83212 RepID=A0A8K0NPM5_9HYPO|nr:hypothetical protein E4U42_000041 [Claviceps africana]